MQCWAIVLIFSELNLKHTLTVDVKLFFQGGVPQKSSFFWNFSNFEGGSPIQKGGPLCRKFLWKFFSWIMFWIPPFWLLACYRMKTQKKYLKKWLNKVWDLFTSRRKILRLSGTCEFSSFSTLYALKSYTKTYFDMLFRRGPPLTHKNQDCSRNSTFKITKVKEK